MFYQVPNSIRRADCYRLGDRGRGASLTTITLSDFARDADADALVTFITEGVEGTGMPAFGSTLTREQIGDVVAYLKSREPAH